MVNPREVRYACSHLVYARTVSARWCGGLCRRRSCLITTSGRRMGACRVVWRRGGAQGLLGINLPEAYGGGEANDFRGTA